MSYSHYVAACIEERTAESLRGRSWWSAALHFAGNHFADYPEHRVVRSLLDHGWPRRGTVDLVLRDLAANVPDSECLRWMDAVLEGRADSDYYRHQLQAVLFDAGARAGVMGLWWVYRLYDRRATLLYVGLTTQGRDRFDGHARDKAWWPDVENFSVKLYRTEDEARGAERAAIERERPVHNVVWHPDRPPQAPQVDALPRELVRTVACPECGAPAGARCKGARGRDRVSNHLSRVVAAHQMLNPQEQAA